MMTAVGGVFYLALFLGSACSLGPQALPGTGRQDKEPISPANNTEEQGNYGTGVVYQQAVGTLDWPSPLGTRIAEDSADTEVYSHATEQHASTSKPVVHMVDIFDSFKSLYTLVDGLGYYRVVKGRYLKWEEARAACQAEGTHLAVINSRREAVALQHLYFEKGIKPDLVIKFAWIGAYRPQGQHHFITVYGTQLKKAGFNTWKDEEHSKDTDERCVLLDVDTTVGLTSVTCGLKEHHICEHEL